MEKCCKNHKETQYSIKIVYVVGKPCNIYRLRGNSIVRIVFSPQSVNITGLLESFGEPPKAAVWQIPAISWRTSKDKKTHICLWFVQTIGLISWLSILKLNKHGKKILCVTSPSICFCWLRSPYISWYISRWLQNCTSVHIYKIGFVLSWPKWWLNFMTFCAQRRNL